MEPKLKNDSLGRGLTILAALAENDGSSLADLHRLTGISKGAIRRILGTLIERRIVRRSLADRLYRTTATLPVSAGTPVPADLAWVVDIAMPAVSDLTRSIAGLRTCT